MPAAALLTPLATFPWTSLQSRFPQSVRLTLLLCCCCLLALTCLPGGDSTVAPPPRCPDGRWLSVGYGADCLLLGKVQPMNLSEARNYCLSLTAGSKLLILRNYRFNQQLLALLNATPNDSLHYWTGAYVGRSYRPSWLDSDYVDASMSPLPGVPATLRRFLGMNGALDFNKAAGKLEVSFLSGANNRAPLCGVQPMESPFLPAVPFDPSLRCPGPQAILHRGLCYRVLNSPGGVTAKGRWNRSVALDACRNWTGSDSASLAVINDYNTEFLGVALVSTVATGHAWIGLEFRAEGDYWAWPEPADDVRHTDWKLNEPTMPYHREPCAVAHQREVSLGEWNNVACGDTFPSALCQSPPVASNVTAAWVPAAPGLNSTKCQPGFFEFGHACWLLGNQTGNRSDMTAVCATLNATLAFFHHRGEQAFLSVLAEQLGSLNGSIWLGLNVNPDTANSGWTLTWDDGSRADYDFVWKLLPNPIKVPQNPLNANDSRICTSMLLKSNSFEARLCNDTGVRLACRYNLDNHPLSPNRSQELFCEDGHRAVNGKCFKLRTAPSPGLSWQQAQDACTNLTKGGSLASVHVRQEQLAMHELFSSDGSKAWLGMVVTGTDGLQRLYWSDNSPVDFYQFRHNYPQQVANGDQLCVLTSGKYAEWMTERCSKQLSAYVCQVPGMPASTSTVTSMATTTQTMTPGMTTVATITGTPASSKSTTSSANRVCEPVSGSMVSVQTHDGSGCIDYLLSGEAKSWREADSWCQRANFSGSWTLASIASFAEGITMENRTQSLVKALRSPPELEFWIGASTERSRVANAFTVWSDGTPMQYANFYAESDLDLRTRLPGSICAAVVLNTTHEFGSWRSWPCSKSLPFLCKRTRLFVSVTAVATTTVAPPVVPTAGATAVYACPPGWTGAPSADDPACFRLLSEAKQFGKARDACAAVKGDLAFAQTPRQLQLMASLLRGNQSAWVGLKFAKNVSGGVYTSLAGAPADSVDWAPYSTTQGTAASQQPVHLATLTDTFALQSLSTYIQALH